MQAKLIFIRRYIQLYRAMSGSIVEAFRFTNPVLNTLTHILCSPFIANLTRLGMKMESIIQADGHMQGASQWIMSRATKGVIAHGANCIPTDKPVLFVGNHAGLGDANAMMMSSPRHDTHTLVFNYGILPGLEAFHDHAIVVDKDNPMFALRETVRHLKQGKSALIYPRGNIEDDPSLYLDSALRSLDEWSASIEFFVKHVPDLRIVPFGVGGVISRQALANPFVRKYENLDHRMFLAATFQLMFPIYRDPIVSIFFGQPLHGEQATLDNVQRQMRRLIRNVHAEQTEIFNETQRIHAPLREALP